MAITYHNSASTPADNGTQAAPGPVAVTPPASMADGDLVVIVGQIRSNLGTNVLTISEAGGQTWTTEASFGTSGSVTGRLFWCRFNGTWSANPSVVSSGGTVALTVVMHVFRPTASSNTWAIDAAQSEVDFSAPSTPFTVTITGQTTTAADTVGVAVWMTSDDNTWDTLAGSGWATTGTAQYRNTTGSDQSSTYAHNIRTSAGTQANVSKNQATLGGDAGSTIIITFKEEAGGGGGATEPGWLGGGWF